MSHAVTLFGMNDLGYSFNNPLIQAFPCCCGRGGDSGVHFGIDPDKQFAGIRFVGLLAEFGAGTEVTVNRFTARAFQFTDRRREN